MKKEIINKTEELYSYYDDLLSRELQLHTLVQNSEITEFVKDCARASCNQTIEALEKIKKQFKQLKVFVPDGAFDTEIQFWLAVRRELEDSKLYED